MNSSMPYRTGIGRTPKAGHPRLAVRWVRSAHPSPLPWKRVSPSRHGGQSRFVGFQLRTARCSLSLRKRVKVRGNDAASIPLLRIGLESVELGESSVEAGVFRRRL